MLGADLVAENLIASVRHNHAADEQMIPLPICPHAVTISGRLLSRSDDKNKVGQAGTTSRSGMALVARAPDDALSPGQLA